MNDDSRLGGIAVVGLAGRFPGAGDVDQLWDNLERGVESITRFSREELLASGVDPALVADPHYVPAAAILDDVEAFDAAFFGIGPREAEITDPQHRLLLETAWTALEHAAIAPRTFAGRVALFAGASLNQYLLENLLSQPDRLARVGPYQAAIGNDKDFLATRVSYRLGLTGPSLAVQTACSTSLVAVSMACQSLANGESDVALAGGVTVRVPQRAGYLYQPEGILSPDGHCRPFDADARGTVPGSGVGLVVLRRLEEALADGHRVHAVIRGWALNNDGGRKVGYTAPSVDGQCEVIAEALALAGLSPAEIGYVEAHGTGTQLGDPIELAALSRVFRTGGSRSRPCRVGSLKGNLGHLDAAAGITGLAKTVLALERGVIPPSLHFTAPNPELGLDPDLFEVAAERVTWERDEVPRRAAVSSFGIGGTNAHVVLEEAPVPAERPAEPGPQLLVLSARTDAALEALADSLARHLERHPEVELRDVAHTLQVGRTPLERRRTLVAASTAEAARRLRAPASGAGERVQAAEEPPAVCFLFPGQGAQHAGMGETLYRNDARYRADIDRCAAILEPHLGFDLRPLLHPAAPDREEAGRRLVHTRLAQPALFVVEYALARRWIDAGVTPDGMLGHSLGELVAATLAGVFALEDALAVVAARGRLMEAQPGGAMDAVALGEEALRPLLDPMEATVSLAAVNGPAQCTVSGSFEAIAAFEERLRAKGVAWNRLDTSHAFHSAMMEPALEPFHEALARVRLEAPVRPFVSSVTGEWITADEARDPGYWVRQLRQPVRFADGFARLVAGRQPVLLEVGPGTTLRGLARRLSRQHTVVASLDPRGSGETADAAGLLPAAGALWSHGVVLDWPGLSGRADRCRVPLPGYPFERARHWVDRDPAGVSSRQRALHKRPDSASWFSFPSWRRAGPAALHRRSGDAETSRWLVVGGGTSALPLAEELRARGCEVTRVESGPRLAADLADRLAGLRAADALPQAVVYVAADDRDAGPSPVSADVEGFLHLLRGLAHHAPGQKVELALVTRGLRDASGRVDGAPGRAALLGLCKVASQEFPQFACRNVDLEGDAAGSFAPAGLHLLADELRSGAVDAVVAHRGGERWLPAFEAVPAEAAPPVGPAIPPGAHVVITGGLGRFGLALAAHLARHHHARVSLLDVAATGSEFRSLAAEGSVRFVRADVADEAAVRAALADTVATFGPVHGVVHAAGHPEEGAYRTLEETTPAHVAAHIAPKLEGLAVLDRVLDGAGLAFATITSSLASILGGVGLAAFAAADAAVEAFVRRRVADRGTVPWQNVAWEAWGEPILDEAHRVLGRPQAALLLTLPEVLVAFDRLLTLRGLPQVAIATGDLDLRLAQWTRVGGAGAAVDPAATAARRPHDTVADPSMSELEQRIAGIWRDALGVDSIAPDDDFFELGGSSLVGLQILSRLRSEFAVELPLRSFFEARTVRGMAVAIEGEGRSETDPARVEQILAEIEAMSEEEAERSLGAIAATPESVPTPAVEAARPVARGLEFGILFFSADGSSVTRGRYDFVLECARIADRRGFRAVWTPERHFVEFGGLYPNPSVLGAALAVLTERIQIRAGSVVLPLHHPVRIAEDWAVVDNLSAGRVAISCASGWHPDDFVIAPERYADRKEEMFRAIELLRRLWAGEGVRLPGPGGEIEVRTLPRPIQPVLPLWVTTSGSLETWERTGTIGANLLAAMGNQSVEELARRIALYRDARARAGHDPAGGVVSLMLHTYVGDDLATVRRMVRGPLGEYLKTHLRQREGHATVTGITADDERALTDLAVDHYLQNASLIGTVETCSPLLERLIAAGVDEIACLVDFGLEPDAILAGLDKLDVLRRAHADPLAEAVS